MNPTYNNNDQLSLCDNMLPFTYGDSTLTVAGNHIVTFSSIHSCDSTITLQLTVNYTAHNAITDTPTDPYTWNVVEYSESGTYSQTFAAASGCDSVVTLTLVITVGIPSVEATGSLSLYPNPTDGKVSISAASVEMIEVMDATGRTVAINKKMNTIDLSTLPTGSYTLRITLPQGVAIRKVVKR